MDPDGNNQLAEKEIINRDRLHFLNIFSEDIWNFIAQRNTDIKEKLLNSSLYFRSLWQDQRTNFLFPKVWQIMCRGWTDVSRDFNSRYVGINRHVDPLFWGRLSKAAYSDLPKIRLVCKTWSNAFDSCYRLPLPRHNIIEDYQFHITAIRSKFTCKFLNFDERYNWGRRTIKFLEHFQSTHGNFTNDRSPFVGNALHVRYTGSDRNRNDCRFFNEGIVEIFSKYSQHVRHLSLTEDVTTSELSGYMKLEIILQETPHLESLKMYHNLLFASYFPPSSYHPVLKGDRLQDLITCVKQNPLPTLKSLQSLKINGNGSAFCILYELLVKNNHISQLVISNLSISKFNLLLIPLANLRELSLTIYSSDDLNALEDHRLNWPLTKLAVDFGIYFHSVDWSKLFSVVERKFSDTLTDFLLTIPQLDPDAAYPTYPTVGDFPDGLYLKHVKRLQVKFHVYSSLDFILPLKDTLEYFSVVDSCQRVDYAQMEKIGKTVEEHGKIEFWGYTQKPMESNIWKHFPKLDRVQYFRDSHNNCVFSRKK